MLFSSSPSSVSLSSPFDRQNVSYDNTNIVSYECTWPTFVSVLVFSLFVATICARAKMR
jgi:hypothetical protein